MNDDFCTIEQIPQPKTLTCKVLVYVIAFLLLTLPFIFAIFGYFLFDFFISFCFLCFGYLVNGVIHSKLRQLCIPEDQREISFSSVEIAKWLIVKHLTCK